MKYMKYMKTRSNACTPHRAHVDDAGLDLAPCEDSHVEPGRTVKLDTGLAFQIEPGHVGLIAARSSTTLRGVAVVGVIDSQFRGSVHLLVTNTSNSWVHIKDGERLAQLMVVPCVTPGLELVTQLDPSDRGTGGLGSTGNG